MGAGVGAGAGAGAGAIAGAGADIEVAVAGVARKSDRFSRASSPGDRASRATEDGAGSIRAAPRVRSADRSPSSDAGAPAGGAASATLRTSLSHLSVGGRLGLARGGEVGRPRCGDDAEAGAGAGAGAAATEGGRLFGRRGRARLEGCEGAGAASLSSSASARSTRRSSTLPLAARAGDAGRSSLDGSRLVCCEEAPDGRRLAVTMLLLVEPLGLAARPALCARRSLSAMLRSSPGLGQGPEMGLGPESGLGLGFRVRVLGLA